jgi:phosphatidylglycerophosphate synthase
MTDLPDARRPLKSRSTHFARAASQALLRWGVRPNQVSVASVLFAIAGAVALGWVEPRWLAWLLAAGAIQLRLLCNLMDGMLAVEGGLRTPNGDLYNECPDRVADPVFMVAIGFAAQSREAEILGWLAACGSLGTAWVRSHGASLTGKHDFRGPMAKPHRMALATALCLIAAVLRGAAPTGLVITIGLAVMNAGIVVTIVRRLATLSRALHDKATRSV